MSDEPTLDEMALQLALEHIEGLPNYELLHWRPISEAKKDGTNYLLCDKSNWWVKGWWQYHDSMNTNYGRWVYNDEDEGHYPEVFPTHFAEVRGPKL